MGIKTETGFTIIEAMLFLAITGLLAVGILVGSGVAIGQQRYRDSVNSLKSYIQQQYSEVTNVTNDRDNLWTCNANGDVTEAGGGTAEPRGTSDCVLLGKFVTIDNNGTQLTSTNVIGYRTTGAPQATSDIAELATNYTLRPSPIGQDVSEVSWGAQVVKEKTSVPMPLSMLIVRSPLSGSILTFTQEGVQTNLSVLLAVGNMNVQRDLCVNADFGTFVGGRMEVRIDPYATNQAAIHVPPESESVCD
jgi:type II secretory pathway pseudopilin PulG